MFSISISPPLLELLIKPGATFIQTYFITNNSTTPINVSATIEAWQPSGPDGNVTYTNVQENPSFTFSLANSDLSLNKNFSLNPGQKQQLILKIKANQAILPGDSYYTLFITQASQTDASARLGSHLLISTSSTENITQKAAVTKLSISPIFKDIFLTPIRFDSLIDNQSNFFFKTQGKIIITKDNLTLKELELESLNVLAHHSRRLQCKNYTACTYTPPFWPGLYTATIKLDNSVSYTSPSVTFFIFPYFLTGLFIVLTTLIIFFAKFLGKKTESTA